MNYYTNELNKLSGKYSIKIYNENGNITKTLDINDESRAALIEWLTVPEPRRVIFTRVNSDSNGNPRYVMDYSQLHDDYETALKMARKLYNMGKSVTIIAHKMALNTPWNLEHEINNRDGMNGVILGTTDFNIRVANFEIHNCNFEMGYYAAYYIKEEVTK